MPPVCTNLESQVFKSASHSIGHLSDAHGLQTLAGRRNGCVHFHRGKIKPVAFAVLQRIQPYPMDDARVILAQFESGNRWCAIHEVHASHIAGPLEIKSPHPIAWDAIEFVITPAEGQTNQLDQLLLATRQMPAQPKETLTVLAEGIQPHRDGHAVRPKGLVAYKIGHLGLTIPCRITTKE